MVLKASLNKPYTDKERMEFIVQNNHKLGYTIKNTNNGLEAYDYTEEEIAEFKKKLNDEAIEQEFKEKKNTILMNYLDAMIHNDAGKMFDLELQMKNLDDWYNQQKGG